MFTKAKQCSIKKLDALISKSRAKVCKANRLNAESRWVVNLTDVPLTSSQEDVLRLGTNFALAPKKKSVGGYCSCG